MSISAIPTTSAAIRARAPAADQDAAATAAPARTSTPTTTTDEAIKFEEAESHPATVRFPWLSRLSQQLEAASNKRPTFANPIIGDNLDKKA